MGKIRRSCQLFAASARVLRAHAELLIFPLLTWAIAAGVSTGTFLWVWHLAETANGHHSLGTLSTSGWLLIICGYFLVSYVVIFGNAALVFSADQALRGENPTVVSGLKAAATRAGAILPWALLSASVSLLLRPIENRVDQVSRFVVKVVGLAWRLTSYLVLPIVVVEQTPTRRAVKRSSELFRKTWGDAIVGFTGIGLAVLGAALLAAPMVILGSTLTASAFATSIIFASLWVVSVIVAGGALRGIYQAALYRFAVDEEKPAAFSKVDLSTVWTPAPSQDG